MADVDGIRLQLNEIEQRTSSMRQTPRASFSDRFRTALGTGASVVSTVAGAAGYNLPAAAVVGAAVTGVGQVQDVSGGLSSNSPAMGESFGSTAGFGSPGGVGGGDTGGVMGAIAGRAQAGDPSSQMMMATQRMQEMNQTFNLQYLQLQQKMQNESRQFTAVSNVMKTKHDTARNALSNLK